MKPRVWLILLAIPLAAILLFRLTGNSTVAPSESVKRQTLEVGQSAPAASRPAVTRAPGKIERTRNPGTPSSRRERQLDRKKFRQYLNGDTPMEKPTAEQLRQHLEANQHSAESLLAAFQSSGDVAWLTNAAARHPDDPRVQFAMVVHGGDKADQRAWLDRLKASDPENALANYLSAKDHFRAGNTEEAIKDLLAGTSKAAFNDYSLHDIQSSEEMYLAAGKSPVESKIKANIQEKLPHLQQLRDLSRDLVKLQQQAADRGDSQTYHDLVQIGMQLGQNVGHSEGVRYLLNDLVGIGIQKEMLATLEPLAAYEFLGGRTPTEAIADLNARRDEIRSASRNAGDIADAQPNDILTYFDRTKIHGELNALQWLANKQANHAQP